MKKIIIILLLLTYSCIILSSCLPKTSDANRTHSNMADNVTDDRTENKEKYIVEGLDELEEWVKQKNYKVLPNNPGKEITTEVDKYGDLMHLIDKISINGYFNITSDITSISVNECSLYDVNNAHDMLLVFDITAGDESISLPCYITYIPQEYLSMAENSPVDCIMAVRHIALHNINSPLIVNEEKLTREIKQVTIGGHEYTAITQEYIDSKYTSKVGAIFIIVDNMIVQIQKPYSNPQVFQALQNIDFEVKHIK